MPVISNNFVFNGLILTQYEPQREEPMEESETTHAEHSGNNYGHTEELGDASLDGASTASNEPEEHISARSRNVNPVDSSFEQEDEPPLTSLNPCETSSASSYGNKISLKQAIARWANAEPSMSMQAISRLLQSLHDFDTFIPSSEKTLFPRQKLDILSMGDGKYIYIANWVLSLRDILSTSELLRNHYTILVNVDGLPLFKSSGNNKFYPILVSVLKINHRPICCGIYSTCESSNREMPNPSILLKKFLSDIRCLKDQPIVVNGRDIILDDLVFACYAPARSALKFTRYHSGYHACKRCFVEGEYHGGHVCLLGVDNRKRTVVSFNAKEDESHHHGISVLQHFGVFVLYVFYGTLWHYSGLVRQVSGFSNVMSFSRLYWI